MANGPTHRVVGGVAGFTAGLYLARNETDPTKQFLQIFGATLGGVEGGAAPDAIEPSLGNPNHRGFFHSVALNGAGGLSLVQAGGDVVEWMRARTRDLEEEFVKATGWQQAVLAFLLALAHLGMGYAVGFTAGYGSHIVIDLATPRSLPLVGLKG